MSTPAPPRSPPGGVAGVPPRLVHLVELVGGAVVLRGGLLTAEPERRGGGVAPLRHDAAQRPRQLAPQILAQHHVLQQRAVVVGGGGRRRRPGGRHRCSRHHGAPLPLPSLWLPLRRCRLPA